MVFLCRRSCTAMDEATTLMNLSPENGRTAFSYREKEHVCRKSWTNISASLFAASKVSRKNMALITLMTSIHIAISGPMASQLHLINSAMWKNKRPTANTTCLAKRPAGNNPKENPATTSSGTGEEFEETYSTSKGRR